MRKIYCDFCGTAVDDADVHLKMEITADCSTLLQLFPAQYGRTFDVCEDCYDQLVAAAGGGNQIVAGGVEMKRSGKCLS